MNIIKSEPNKFTIEISMGEAMILRDATLVVSPEDHNDRRLARNMENLFDFIVRGMTL